MRNEIDTLFSKHMTRKEFVQHIGSALLIVFGVGGLISALQSKSHHVASSAGYGASAYGGQKARV